MNYNRRYNPDRHGIWCWYCHGGLTPEIATQDHIIPLSRGGTWHWYNLAWVCSRCNGLKSNLLLEEFRPLFTEVTGREAFAFETSSLISPWFEELGPNFYVHRCKISRLKFLEGKRMLKKYPSPTDLNEVRLFTSLAGLTDGGKW